MFGLFSLSCPSPHSCCSTSMCGLQEVAWAGRVVAFVLYKDNSGHAL
jgi:hypothetical protein